MTQEARCESAMALTLAATAISLMVAAMYLFPTL